MTPDRLIFYELTPAQVKLKRKHGTPATFAEAVYKAVPEFLSMTEASDAVHNYQEEWEKAGWKRKGKRTEPMKGTE